MKEVAGNMVIGGKRFALVVSRFNELISREMLNGALDTLLRHGVKDNELTVVWVPGAFEIPAVVHRLLHAKKHDAIICLGAVIRGDTPHFDYIAAEVSKGIAQIGMASDIPVSFGILTVDSLEQALERAGSKAGNKGRQAAETAIEMVNLAEQL